MSHEQQEADRLLAGPESGAMDTGTAQNIAEEQDPISRWFESEYRFKEFR